MFWAQAAMLVALAAFVAYVVHRHHRLGPSLSNLEESVGLPTEQVRGFGYVGALGLVLVAGAVVILGLVRHDGVAEGVAVGGFFAFFAYLTAAGLLLVAARGRSGSAPVQPVSREPDGDGPGRYPHAAGDQET